MNCYSFRCQHFDPALLHRHLAPKGPGFLESLNPLKKTGRFSLVPLRHRESYSLSQKGLQRHRNGEIRSIPGDPFEQLGAILRQHPAYGQRCDSPFPGGFFGWFGYDLAGWIEDLPQRAQRDLPLPALWLDWVDLTAVYHHDRQTLTLTCLDDDTDLTALAQQISALLQQETPVFAPYSAELPQPILQQAEFEAMVHRAKDYIAAGDIYQANLSCRFDGRFDGDPLALYQDLKAMNPSPFACFLQTPQLTIVSSSPERLVSLEGDLAETRPIAGTRPRGYTPPEDHQLGEELLGHPKERAEHIMLLDLERNDLGKVCRGGTVEVDELMVLERYSHVTHIVSNVRGRLKEGLGPFDLLKATFPGGTITGVPKKRCMEIIDELEPVGRGSYTGSAGYISTTGDMDLNILIRTFQILADRLTYQVGAGIVADSVPEKEWHECLAKGKALRKTLEAVC